MHASSKAPFSPKIYAILQVVGLTTRRAPRVFANLFALLSRLSLLAGHHSGPFRFGPESFNGSSMPSSRS